MKLNNLFGNPELIKVSELRPYGHNAKHFDESVYNDLEKSFKEFGDVGICLCDLDGTLIDGNTRLKFFKDNNIEFCYARKAIKKLTEKQVVRLNAILDNIGNKPDFSVIDVEILEEIKVDYDTVVVDIEEIKSFADKNKEIDTDFEDQKYTFKLEYSEDEYSLLKSKIAKIGKTPEQIFYEALI